MHIFDVSVFGFQIAPTWYGLMYAIGFTFCYFFVGKYGKIQQKHMDTLLLYIFFGVVGGWRLWYVLFYDLAFFWAHPLDIFAIWNWGMSFHGGFLGVLISTFLFGRRYGYRFFDITDILAVCLPVALGLGRIGNWINAELPWYAPYNWPFSMQIDGVWHFPNPLLEMVLEGIVLFLILFALWYSRARKKYTLHRGMLSAVFLIWYSIARLIAEGFRLPDTHIGYLLGTDWLTLGIIYTSPMLIAGCTLLMLAHQKKLD